MNVDLIKHILKYSLFIILTKLILFIVGTFIENQTVSMAILNLVYLFAFCSISIVMIRNFNGNTKLKLTQKLIAVAVLFLAHEFLGILLHSIYFVGILGQEPTSQELLNKSIGILKFDSHILIITAIISIFINSKTMVGDKSGDKLIHSATKVKK